MNQHEAWDALLSWFYRVREPHFFRQQRNPYRVWIAEVALQQTRIQAVLEPLQRFFKAFPDVKSLAAASEEEVLYQFRGLGYYSRARNLRKGAQYLLAHHQGELPQKYHELLRVPSIGAYTAAALSSICYGEKQPVCDGNVKRILCRMHRWEQPIRHPQLTKKCNTLLEKVFTNLRHHPGDANEALMELGQKICSKSPVLCHQCPVARWCQAFAAGKVGQYPIASPQREKIRLIWHLYLIEDGKGSILMQKWENFYFLKGQVSFPSILEFVESEELLASWKTSVKTLAKRYREFQKQPIISAKHSITHHDIEIRAYPIARSKATAAIKKDPSTFWLRREEISSRLVSSALIKVWEKFLAG